MSARPFAYIRRSATGNSGGDISRDFQTGKVRELAGNEPELQIIDRDWGKSGSRHKRSQREGLDELLEAIEAGEVTAVYAYAADRLARDTETAMHLLNACERRGVPIVTREGAFTPGDRSARLLFTVQAATNEDYSSQAQEKRQATVAVQKARIAAHEATCASLRVCGDPRKHLMGALPFGMLEGEDIEAVLNAFRESGSYQGAARLLIERGVRSRRSHLRSSVGIPLTWTGGTVRRLVRASNPELVPVAPTRGSRTISIHRFTRLLVCPHDNSFLTPAFGRNVRGYTCKFGNRSPYGEHPQPYFIRESVVLEWAIAATRSMLRLGVPATREGETSPAMAALRSRLDRYTEMYGEGDITRETYEAKRAEIKAELERLEGVRRVSVTWHLGVDWAAPEGEVNARLRDLLHSIRLEHVERFGPVRGRHTGIQQSLVPAGGVWRRQPVTGEEDVDGSPTPDPEAVLVTGGWYLASARVAGAGARLAEARQPHPVQASHPRMDGSAWSDLGQERLRSGAGTAT